MSEQSYQYHSEEFKFVGEDRDHIPTIQIYAKNGKTKHLSISWKTFDIITQVILDQDRQED